MTPTTFARSVALALFPLMAPLRPEPAAAQFVQASEQFYLPAAHNWTFRDRYQTADRLFNAFDYGHAVLYETLYSRPDAPIARLEAKEYDFIVNELLVKPPRVPLEEEAIMGQYAKLAPEAKLMFEWAHILHRQIYDVYADPSVVDKDAAVDELVRYYRSRPDVAFSTVPKSMTLMEGQPYSLAFRRAYPKFNGLIWAYHWLQVGLYEPMIVGRTDEERQKGVTAAVARFWSMLENPPSRMPSVMPMTPAVAPEFTRRHPAAAAIFDNLHATHDVISDVLASPLVPRKGKREAILTALAAYRDDTTEATMRDEWIGMAGEMGVENMGGPAVGVLAPLPDPQPMAGHGKRQGAMHGGMQPGDADGMDDGRPAAAAGTEGAKDPPGQGRPDQPSDQTDQPGDETETDQPARQGGAEPEGHMPHR